MTSTKLKAREIMLTYNSLSFGMSYFGSSIERPKRKYSFGKAHVRIFRVSQFHRGKSSLYTVEMANVESRRVRIHDFFKILRLNHKLCDLLCNSTLICCCIHELLKSFEPDSDVRINKDDFIACLRRNPLLVALFSPQLMHKNLSRDEEVLDEVYASNGSKPAPDYSRPKRRLWDRFPIARTVQQMMETMERMMEDPFVYTSEWPSPTLTETGGYSRRRTPWKIKEREGEYKMRFNMPGMTKDDVKVYVEEKMLVVKAEKMTKDRNGQESEVENEEWSAKSQGRYSSRVALPENVEFEKIKAEVKDGVLYITIPKASGTSKVLDINVQ
ncbi:hypothetical protein LOK49_LG13G02321 [Camellia lanceoleosa]|uniref:Uncharacterized protein n=1 Tax=Camellia lanceoleosa TaxID=1840588 RepID=A0ACC0FHL5_9ERIC|nr:hypothetical protein LOK49_LG13G02321 [Camellia lanceoleosa]